MCGYGRMADEADFGARREEPRPQVVAFALGRENERGVGVVELARDGKHLRVGQAVGIEHDAGGIPGEAVHREGIHLMHLDFVSHRSRSIPAGGPGGAEGGHSSP